MGGARTKPMELSAEEMELAVAKLSAESAIYPGPDELYDMADLHRSIETALATLSIQRGAEVLHMRFWEDLSLKEIGEKFGLKGGSRAGQIEAKTLRLLQHPSRRRILADFVDPRLLCKVPDCFDQLHDNGPFCLHHFLLGCEHGELRDQCEHPDCVIRDVMEV